MQSWPESLTGAYIAVVEHIISHLYNMNIIQCDVLKCLLSKNLYTSYNLYPSFYNMVKFGGLNCLNSVQTM